MLSPVMQILVCLSEAVTISLMPHEAVTSARIYEHVGYWFVHIPLPISNFNACEGYALRCPLKEGIPVKLVCTQKVSEHYPPPPGTYMLDARLKDQNGDMVACGVVDLTIV